MLVAAWCIIEFSLPRGVSLYRDITNFAIVPYHIRQGRSPGTLPFTGGYESAPDPASREAPYLTTSFQPRLLELHEAGRPRRWLVVSSTHGAEV